MTTWIVYTKEENSPLWRSDNKNDLDIIIKKLPDAISTKLYIAKATKTGEK